MPTITSRKPTFGRWAPILTCILWCSVVAAWILFLLITPAHPAAPPDAKDYIHLAGFFGMLFGTAIFFAAGLIILAASAISYGIRSRQYRQEQEALAASRSVPPL